MKNVFKAMPLVILFALIIAVPSLWANWIPDGVALCTAIGIQEIPKIVSDGTGGAIVTWQDARSGSEYDIYAQRINASGEVQWTANGVAICTATGNQKDPEIISDSAGGAIVMWTDYRGSYIRIYAQRVNASGVIQWAIDGLAPSPMATHQSSVKMISDGAGGAIFTWIDARYGNVDIFVQRINASGANQWLPELGVSLCTAANSQFSAEIASDGAGGAIVTWQDWRNWSDYDIYAQRVDASGAVRWKANGVALCNLLQNQENPRVISDDAGGAIVVWQDLRSGQGWYYLYAQRINASGEVQWTANGVALCTTTHGQGDDAITRDGASGAIVTWDSYLGVCAQRINASGAVQWTVDGIQLCPTGDALTQEKQYNPTIASDGMGGAIVAWDDFRSGNGDIYAQRVNASGDLRWTTNGVALCTATGHQQYPAITCDGLSPAIVTWKDDQSNNGTTGDIYCYGFTQPLTAADVPAMPVELHQNYPNPFNPSTTIEYCVPNGCRVSLEVCDISGRRIASLVDREQGEGFYEARWNGKDARGDPVASGVYFCRLTAGNQTISKKIVLLK